MSRQDIGAIRIAANETMFEIPSAIVSRFIGSVKRTGEANDEGADVAFEQIEGAPREAARENRREGPRGKGRPNEGRGPKPAYGARPFKGGPRKGAPRKPRG